MAYNLFFFWLDRDQPFHWTMTSLLTGQWSVYFPEGPIGAYKSNGQVTKVVPRFFVVKHAQRRVVSEAAVLVENLLVSWCFESSQPQRITSGLNTNFILSPSHSFHKSSYHKSCFWSYLFSTGTQHRNLHPAGWPILFCGSTQEPCVSHSQHRKIRQRFWKKSR